ncbi:acyl-CoA thioesterase [Actinomadura rupiterrae]|uniref:acyl-CoA thioesterase n=1 Tax=Actinomadura rupiterrae TaxID=559627 RepID=UPI0020A2B700|nr:hotdog domain-containing protein [Actinomadura rupiterrae]MCP2342338.1 acyl-CoA thioester hydrolase [Actinomadura rupiterrae]
MPGEPSSVSVLQRVELCDTDVTGHYHHSTVIRWVESAEQTLLHRIGLDHLPVMPRVNYNASYRSRLWRHEVVETRLRVAKLGRTSLSYEFEVRSGAETPSVEGSLTVVKVAPLTGEPLVWESEERDLLLRSGSQEGDFLRPGRRPAPATKDPSTLPMARPVGDEWGIGYG